ncbi:hypothetical protein ACS5LO_000233 [Citrobacter koseri]
MKLKSRITFAYPTWIQPGMSIYGPFRPDTAFQVEALPMDIEFFLSFGMVLALDEDFSVEVNVFYNEKPLISEHRAAVDSRMLSPVVSSSNEFVTASVMKMNSITIENEGVYKIRITLYGGHLGKDRVTLDEYDCFFVVSREWKPFPMGQTKED